MRLNTRGRYGIQLMEQLACHGTESQPLGLKQVAEATGLPWRYLEQIARPLRKAALVRGRAGRTGGYYLGRLPDQVSLRDVIEAASGPICFMDCVDHPDACEHSLNCASRQVWLAVTDDIRGVLDRYTLCDLARRPCAGCSDTAEAARVSRVAHKPALSGTRPANKRPGASGKRTATTSRSRARPAGRS
ncbi:MAG: Rrf2 family transcriptional regulator [Vicinamibacterales bacterium]|nr:Rrf2 family transcriptional regulator [Vicinamibacterales bacterium]